MKGDAFNANKAELVGIAKGGIVGADLTNVPSNQNVTIVVVPKGEGVNNVLPALAFNQKISPTQNSGFAGTAPSNSKADAGLYFADNKDIQIQIIPGGNFRIAAPVENLSQSGKNLARVQNLPPGSQVSVDVNPNNIKSAIANVTQLDTRNGSIAGAPMSTDHRSELNKLSVGQRLDGRPAVAMDNAENFATMAGLTQKQYSISYDPKTQQAFLSLNKGAKINFSGNGNLDITLLAHKDGGILIPFTQSSTPAGLPGANPVVANVIWVDNTPAVIPLRSKTPEGREAQANEVKAAAAVQAQNGQVVQSIRNDSKSEAVVAVSGDYVGIVPQRSGLLPASTLDRAIAQSGNANMPLPDKLGRVNLLNQYSQRPNDSNLNASKLLENKAYAVGVNSGQIQQFTGRVQQYKENQASPQNIVQQKREAFEAALHTNVNIKPAMESYIQSMNNKPGMDNVVKTFRTAVNTYLMDQQKTTSAKSSTIFNTAAVSLNLVATAQTKLIKAYERVQPVEEPKNYFVGK